MIAAVVGRKIPSKLGKASRFPFLTAVMDNTPVVPCESKVLSELSLCTVDFEVVVWGNAKAYEGRLLLS